jgi:hypothetical protein
MKQCSICDGPIDEHRHPVTGEVYWTEGHNAEPINDGRCCDECNDVRVLPRRMANALAGEDPYEGKGIR